MNISVTENREGKRTSKDRTFQVGTLDVGMVPIPKGLRGRSSPDWPGLVRHDGHAGDGDKQDVEEVGEEVKEEKYGGEYPALPLGADRGQCDGQ